jgi:hypothetical protein
MKGQSALLLTALFALSFASPARADEGARQPSLGDEAALELGLDFHVFSRSFRYEDDYYGFLRGYRLGAGPSMGFNARWYPGKHATDGWPSIFGVGVRFDHSFGLASERSNQVQFPTTNRMVEVNALARFQIGEQAVVGIFGFGSHFFELGLDDPWTPATLNTPDVPSVNYRYLRYGAEGRLVFHPLVGALVGASFLQVLDAGGIDDRVWFPRATTNGAELAGHVVLRIAHGLEARLGVAYRRYFMAMNAEVGDDYIAGGALDQYVFYTAGLVYRH